MELGKVRFEKMVSELLGYNHPEMVTISGPVTVTRTVMVSRRAPECARTLSLAVKSAKESFGGFYGLRVPETGGIVPLYRRAQLPSSLRGKSLKEVHAFIIRMDNALETGTLKGISF